MDGKNLKPSVFEAIFVNNDFTRFSCLDECITQYCMEFASSVSASIVQNSTLDAIIDALYFCPQLKSLSLTHTDSTDLKTCDSLIITLSVIKRTSLTSFDFSGFLILKDTHIILICENYSQLTCLNVCDCTLLTDKGIRHISSCSELTNLNLSNTKLTNVSLSHFNKRCLKLQHLVLAKCTLLRFDIGKLRDFFFSNGSGFLSVDICEISPLTPATKMTSVVAAIAHTCHNLTSLRLGSSCVPSMQAVTLPLCRNCSHIITLNLDAFTNLSVCDSVLMMKSFVRLSDFSFKGCLRPVKFTFYCLMAQKLKTISCLKLHHSHVIGVPFVNLEVPLVNDDITISYPLSATDYATVKMHDKCAQLKELSIAATTSEESFLSFKSSKCPDIVHLSVIKSYYIDDSLLADACIGWSSLLSFHVEGCRLISSLGIVHVCHHSPLIRDVFLHGGSDEVMPRCAIDDVALVNGVSTLKFLRKLSIFWLPLITQSGLSHVTSNCTKLVEVHVSDCIRINIKAMYAKK
jgi:hypothetical protein